MRERPAEIRIERATVASWRKIDGITNDSPDVTRLLHEWRNGDGEALGRLLPMVEGELRRIARRCMRGERAGHSLQATALVNEAYMRLVDAQRVQWQDRSHFLAISAKLMRQVLVDHARARLYQKRGGGAQRVTLVEDLGGSDERPHDLLALDDALEALARANERKAQVVELRFFGGLTLDETGHVLGVSTDTVERDWKLAKAWLLRELRGSEE
jgi:RNA polymerase sigma factor (TIGR02999 family)